MLINVMINNDRIVCLIVVHYNLLFFFPYLNRIGLDEYKAVFFINKRSKAVYYFVVSFYLFRYRKSI